jgi:hypothetical protein
MSILPETFPVLFNWVPDQLYEIVVLVSPPAANAAAGIWKERVVDEVPAAGEVTVEALRNSLDILSIIYIAS